MHWQPNFANCPEARLQLVLVLALALTLLAAGSNRYSWLRAAAVAKGRLLGNGRRAAAVARQILFCCLGLAVCVLALATSTAASLSAIPGSEIEPGPKCACGPTYMWQHHTRSSAHTYSRTHTDATCMAASSVSTSGTAKYNMSFS